MAAASEISSEMSKSQLHPPPSAGSKKGRDKDKSRKTKDVRHSVHIGVTGELECSEQDV